MVSSRTVKHLCPLNPLTLLNNSNVKKILGYKMATENSLEVYINPMSSGKYVENMYYMNFQLIPLSLDISSVDITLCSEIHFVADMMQSMQLLNDDEMSE